MSSKFVSAGSNEQSAEKTNDDWTRAQRLIEESRKIRSDAGKQDGGKSLYEVLQQNKASKQEAFEESARLKNQFRSLDDDEVEFLDSVLESTRAKEAAVKQETAEQLEIFRKQREEAEKALFDEQNILATGDSATSLRRDEESWTTTSKKRRREKVNDARVEAKVRKMSSSTLEHSENQLSATKSLLHPSIEQSEKAQTPRETSRALQSHEDHVQSPSKLRTPPDTRSTGISAPSGLGLGGYSSDSD